MTGFSKVDSGLINYHNHVITDIAKAAVEEIDGVTLIPQSFGDTVLELLGIRRCSGVEIHVDREANAVSLEVKVCVRYGLNIPDVAEHVQEIIRERFDQLTDVDLRDVNVNVYGVERGKV
ncbi:MAG: Asp23/Gls24 family envelope stress response protein [Candidatus Omnitrophica bacterium]|nr:Asp23/Gls24 family envelope stress response protein [Candidatus Omnitrophota bacterium]